VPPTATPRLTYPCTWQWLHPYTRSPPASGARDPNTSRSNPHTFRKASRACAIQHGPPISRNFSATRSSCRAAGQLFGEDMSTERVMRTSRASSLHAVTEGQKAQSENGLDRSGQERLQLALSVNSVLWARGTTRCEASPGREPRTEMASPVDKIRSNQTLSANLESCCEAPHRPPRPAAKTDTSLLGPECYVRLPSVPLQAGRRNQQVRNRKSSTLTRHTMAIGMATSLGKIRSSWMNRLFRRLGSFAISQQHPSLGSNKNVRIPRDGLCRPAMRAS
jgi:hypothetical protein